jgi:hypothetical protein
LLQTRLLADHGWKCTAVVVLNIVLRAAARSISVSAACRDLAKAPSDQAVMTALDDGLPKTLVVLERRLNESLTGPLPRALRRRRWPVAIDWHLSPYYGEPYRSRNELYYGKPRQGTKLFHAYASACIVQYGRRYTLALSWVRRHESTVVVLRRLLARIGEMGLKIKCLLLDRAFFNVPVVEFLQQEETPFLMPVMFRGRRPKKRRPATGLHWIKRQRRLVSAYDEKPEAGGDGLLRGLPGHRNRKTGAAATEAAVRGVGWVRRPRSASAAASGLGSKQLSPTAAGADLHLHPQSPPAAGLCGAGVDPAQRVGVDPSDTPRRRDRKAPETPPRMPAIQAHARLDRLRSLRPIP